LDFGFEDFLLVVFHSPNEVNEIIKHILHSKSSTKYRDALIIRLTYDTGARIGEILNLRLRDCDFKKGLFKFKNTKGREVRPAVCSLNTLKALNHYVEYYLINDDEDAYLFQNKHGNKISYSWVNYVFSKAVNTLVMKGTLPKNKRITLHSLRHGRVVDLLNKGYPIDIVSEVVGHKDIKTTKIYAHSKKRKMLLLKQIQKDLM
jgi:integrase/recombinase XerD